MKRSDALALKPGDRVQVKPREKFKNLFDKSDKSITPGEILVVSQVDKSACTNLPILAFRNGDEENLSWLNHHSIKKVKATDELPSSS